MKEFWNERYGQEAYAYGTEPNAFFKSQLDQLSPGRLLLPAEGEGRNAVYAAKKGFKVSAYDWSEAACAKATKLAEQHQVKIDYQICSLEHLAFAPEQFDALAMIYVHFAQTIRSQNLTRLLSLLKPGGSFIFEAFSDNHLDYQERNPAIGGPKDPQVLYSLEGLLSELNGHQLIYSSQEETTLSEGTYHQGLAEVVRIHALKP
jgi:SAM-dependent methyltransferase